MTMTDTEAKALALVNDTARATEGHRRMTDIEKVARAIVEAMYQEALTDEQWAEVMADGAPLMWGAAAIAAMQPAPQWQGIESAPRDGTKAILYFPQYATDFDGVDYSYSLAIYRKNSTFPLGTWCDQGTNHDSFEGPDMTGCDKASHWMPLPTPPAGGSDAE